MHKRWLAVLVVLSAGCATSDDVGDELDYQPVSWMPSEIVGSTTGIIGGVPAVFTADDIMSDEVLTTPTAVTADQIQSFLEATPYGTRSWLANETMSGGRFADGLVAIATAQGIDPVVLLARAQVESGLVSKTVAPSSSVLNTALGCGCPDGSACSRQDEGLAKQVTCAAQVLATQDAASHDGTGQWVTGKARKTSDAITVIPANDATAALYAYTPWVLTGKGGNWLVWNVTRLYLKAFDEAGALALP